jgi:hypothetical protein
MKYLAMLIGVFLCSSVSFATSLPPARPTNLTATAVSSSQIKLSWTDNSNNETKFKIERSGNGTTFVQISAVGVNVTAYIDSVPQASTKYYYRVRAYDSGGNSGYSNTVSATTAPSPAPSPTASPRPTPTQNIWIAKRTDGLPGSGTQADPFNGSTPAKFDALMFSYYWTYNLGVHLVGPGPFRTYATHQWAVRPGWVLSGDGMYSTTLQMVGSVAGIHYTVNCISSSPNISSDYITIQDLTVDCNWAELSQTADTGAGGEKNIATSAIVLFGSNNLVQRVRTINCYGSWANLKESFGISLNAPVSSDGTNNVIQFCRAELPQGNMQDAFALNGWVSSTPYHLITNSKVLSSTCVGVNNGTVGAGFTSAGVNLGNVQNCVVDGNSFTDCYGAAYNDTGSLDGVQITNNTVIRGWEGVGLRTSLGPTLPKQNILIRGNNINIQNRVPGGGSYGIVLDQQVTTNLTIDHNTITFDGSGVGGNQSFFFGMYLYLLNTATISNNTIGVTNFQYYNSASGSGLTMFNNRTPDGTLIPTLNNR